MLKDPAFWSALITICFIGLAYFWPEQKETFDQLSAPVAAIILAILARSTALQIAAFKYEKTKNEKGEWVDAKRSEQGG